MSLTAIEEFTSPQALEQYGARCDAIAETIDVLGLQGQHEAEYPALAIGGAALAMQGVDAHVYDGKMFDLDVIVSNPTFFRLHQEKRFTGGIGRFGKGAHGVIMPSKQVPLKVDVLSSDEPTDFDMFMANTPYTGQPNNLVHPISGVHVLDGTMIIAQKARLSVARVKDLASVVKSGIFAEQTGNPIANKELWKVSVALAIERVVQCDVEIPLWRRVLRRGPKYPSWLKELVDIDFKHPVFDTIPRARDK
jgi:hypothetical protein